MPMPHRTFAEVAKRRLVGKDGSDRVATIRALLEELPGYRNGPYADLRKWLEGELDRTRMRAKVVHRDSLQAPLSFDRLNGGEAVSFDVQSGPKGPRAAKRKPKRAARPRSAAKPKSRSKAKPRPKARPARGK